MSGETMELVDLRVVAQPEADADPFNSAATMEEGRTNDNPPSGDSTTDNNLILISLSRRITELEDSIHWTAYIQPNLDPPKSRSLLGGRA